MDAVPVTLLSSIPVGTQSWWMATHISLVTSRIIQIPAISIGKTILFVISCCISHYCHAFLAIGCYNLLLPIVALTDSHHHGRLVILGLSVLLFWTILFVEHPHFLEPVYIYTHTHTYMCVYLSIYLSVCLPACLPVCLYVCLSVCLSLYLSVCLSVCMSVCLSIYLSLSLSIYLSVCLFVCMSIYLSI